MPDEPVYIDTLEIENVKRIKAFRLKCDDRALTIIGGNNCDGKTTVLDTVCFLLGGERYRPSSLKRDDSLANPEMKLTLSNGLVAERKGKNAALKVTDPDGNTGGQQLLNKFIHHLALVISKFLEAKSAEKADILLQIIGVGDKLKVLESEEEKSYNERHAIGQIADQKRKYADELTSYPDAPNTPVSASELIHEQQEILAKNGENQRKRQEVEKIKTLHGETIQDVTRLTKELADAEQKAAILTRDLATANKTVKELQDESTVEIETKLNEIDAINVQVRSNMDKEKANEEAEEHNLKYGALSEKIVKIRAEKKALLDGADLPLPGLSVVNGELTYNDKAWDCMAGSEQLRVATAIVRRLNPKCGFVLIDHLEAFDLPTLHDFGIWLRGQGLRVLGTRVSKGDECSIIIEDGFSVEGDKKTFVHGEF